MLHLLTSLLVLTDLNGTVVFHDGLAGVPNYRIPSIIQTSNHTLIAFAEARHGGDQSANRIAVRSSTDGGQTWSDVVFAAGATDTPDHRKECAADATRCRVGNPAAVYDAISQRVILLFALRSFAAGEAAIGTGLATSSDGGRTWSPVRDVSADFGPASGSMPGPGTALQLDAKTSRHPGRLLVVGHHGPYQQDYVTYSDDLGATWTTISRTFPTMDEAALTQLPNGSVLLNMRHANSSKVGRAVAISDDDGETFGPITFDARLVSPVCQASIVSFGGATYFSNPASSTGRNHLTIRKSVDSTASWAPTTMLVQAGNSAGYSCLVKGELQGGAEQPGGPSRGHGRGGILYEDTAGSISFATFPTDFSSRAGGGWDP